MNAITSAKRAPTASRYALGATSAALLVGAIDLAYRWFRGGAAGNQHNPSGLLGAQLAAFFTPAPSLLRAGSDRAELAVQLAFACQALLVALFIIALYRSIRRPRLDAVTTSLVAAQVVLGVALDSLPFSLLAAVQLAALFSLRQGVKWLGAQFALGVALDVLLILLIREQRNDAAFQNLLAVLTFERCVLPLAFLFAWMVRREHESRLSLAASHAHLQATQSLLRDTVRASERMRIARNLHDAVGHHLTALNLHLDLATRQAGAAAPVSLGTSRELAQALLSEVRAVVSTERQDHQIDLGEALRLLCAGIPRPGIRLQVESSVDRCSPAIAHALFHCVQEALTNTMRHANAALLTIDIALRAGTVTAAIADDGTGSHGAAEGNGLAGMRERVAELGGTVLASSVPGQGFRLDISLPDTMVIA